MVLKFVFIIIWMICCLIHAEYENKDIAQPGCKSKCGNISIPFPFGMENSRCYASKGFEIVCSEGEKPVPYLSMIKLEVTFIDVLRGMVLVMNPIQRRCQRQRNGGTRGTNITLGESPFVYSDDYNSFVVVGCHSYGFLLSNDSEVSGCVSMCEDHPKYNRNYYKNVNAVDIASCGGMRCCKTSMPSYLREYRVELENLYETNLRSGECIYGLIKADFDHPFVNYEELSRNWAPKLEELNDLNDVPSVLEWEITIDTIKAFNLDADGDGHYCNKTNVTSQPSNKGNSGYRCACQEGFQGNPYIQGGCIIAKMIDRNKRKGREKWVIIGVSSSLGTIILLFGLSWLHKVVRIKIAKKRKEKFFKQNGGFLLKQRLSSSEVNVDKITLFSLKDLEKATDNFNINRVLGKGGQGTVYKGMLVDGQIVAVKKFKVNGKIEEFINEFVILSQINHRNIVKLLGCCLETKIPLLVYEFIPNGNLFEYLHEQNKDLRMTWDMRLRIATEVAGALFYLHSAASQPVYHRDIKSRNILLDGKYKAKIADFGASRMVSIEATHLTTTIQGTFGYLDPEYFHTSQLTEKSDVYSFGVVLVELLSGKKPISSNEQVEHTSLASNFVLCMEENRLFDIVDERIIKEGVKEQIIIFANLARRCLELNGKSRPTMKEVTLVLESIKKLEAQSNTQEYEELARVEDSQFWALNSSTSNSGQTSNRETSTFEIMSSIK
ncbi:hypothetical protein Fmac_009520 [Flemingia macrophylla]|uniref:Protein kinase domain-containing protein n=1 Tax=Flemingia macrophylla TaxID=520843 RepID=A0ABD1N0G9_9FABA